MNAKERYELSKDKRRRNDTLLAVGVCLVAVVATLLMVLEW